LHLGTALSQDKMGAPSFNSHNPNSSVGRQALEHEQHNMYRRILAAKSQVKSATYCQP
jgi:hypothetical protein